MYIIIYMKAYKFRLYPSSEQEIKLNNQIELCRELYNSFIIERRYAYKGNNISLNYTHQANEIPELKNTFEEYKGIHSQVLQDVAQRVNRAYKNFFRRNNEKKQGKRQKAGFPRLKGKGQYKSLTYPQSGFDIMENGHVELSKIGIIRMFQHREINGDIKTLNISTDKTGKWYASFSVEQENLPVVVPLPFINEPTENTIGADVGLLHLITFSDGTVIDPPKFLRKGEKSIGKAQKNLSQKKKGSSNRNKSKIILSKRHKKVKNQREDFAHKLSKNIVDNNDVIVFENLNVKGMVKNHRLAKSIADASWNTLVQYTTYKAESAGKEVVLVDPRNTSKTCSSCGCKKKSLKLSERIFHCDSCGVEIDRDLNASINILNRGIEKVGRGTPEVTPVEIGALPARTTPVTEAGSPRL